MPLMDSSNVLKQNQTNSSANNVNLKFIQEYLKENNLNADVKFTGQLCSGLCGEGPIVTINNKVYKGVDKIKLAEILDKTFK